MEEKKLSFEQSMARLDEIVRHLEKGDLPLDDSLRLFEEGTSLVRLCEGMLDAAEQKIVKLKKGPDRRPVESDFEDDNGNDS